MSMVGVLSNCLLRYWSASVVRRTSTVRSSPPRTIVGVRTPSYDNTSSRCRRRLVGLVRRRGAVRFIPFVGGAVRFIRLPGAGVWREDCSSGLFRLCRSSFCRLLDILTSHNIAGYLRTGGQREGPSFN